MSLHHIVINNIKRNFKKYVMYFFSLTFSVFTIYSFFALMENDSVALKFSEDTRYKSMLIGFAIVIVVFVFFFLLSSNNNFIRARKKEISTFALFGMSNQRIWKMLFFETMLVGIAGVIIGIAAGIFFSKMTAMILLSMTMADFKGDIEFSISAKAIFTTAVIFFSVFCVMGLSGLRVINKFELVELFKANKTSEGKVKGSVISMIISLLLIIGGYFLAIQHNPDTVLIASIPILCLVIGGTYLFFRGGLPKVMQMLKRNRKKYYVGSTLIASAAFSHRIKSIAGAMATIAVLSAVSTTIIATGYTLYNSIEANTYMNIGYDMFYYSGNLQLIDGVHALFSKYDIDIQSEYQTGRFTCKPVIVSVTMPNDIYQISGRDNYLRIYSQSEYNQLISVSRTHYEPVTINDNEMMLVVSSYMLERLNVIGIKASFNEQDMQITSTSDAGFLSFGAMNTAVISDNDFDKLLSSGEISSVDSGGTPYDRAYVFKYENPLRN
ncbi:MAG: ABC transporter permease, partial [Clostridia bacterium]|nr:ABC transporter permease [Clostridia bacterium]